jgi:hypothetical protein
MHESVAVSQDDPDQWLVSTDFLDLDDAKVRLRARSLTQLCKSEREKALAIYAFVKRMPFDWQFKLSLRGPRKVLEVGRGDGLDKVGLLLALLRVTDIPSRIRFMDVPGEMLRGLVPRNVPTTRAVAEIWLGGKWVGTDTYIFDAAYTAAARQRLREQGWKCGYGMHLEGASIWNGSDNAFLVGEAVAAGMQAGDLFQDPAAFIASPRFCAVHPRGARVIQRNLLVPPLRRLIRKLRNEAVSGTPSRGTSSW